MVARKGCEEGSSSYRISWENNVWSFQKRYLCTRMRTPERSLSKRSDVLLLYFKNRKFYYHFEIYDVKYRLSTRGLSTSQGLNTSRGLSTSRLGTARGSNKFLFLTTQSSEPPTSWALFGFSTWTPNLENGTAPCTKKIYCTCVGFKKSSPCTLKNPFFRTSCSEGG